MGFDVAPTACPHCLIITPLRLIIMNKIYKLVWNDALQTWVSVSEISPSRGKKSTLVGSLALPAHAASIGLRIDNGSSNPSNPISNYSGVKVDPLFDPYVMRGIQVEKTVC